MNGPNDTGTDRQGHNHLPMVADWLELLLRACAQLIESNNALLERVETSNPGYSERQRRDFAARVESVSELSEHFRALLDRDSLQNLRRQLEVTGLAHPLPPAETPHV